MRKILFPAAYKNALLNKTKNTTIRIENEFGKYKKDCIYSVFSYNGKDFGIIIKIKKIINCKISDLDKYKIPKNSINSLLTKNNLSLNSKVQLINFDYIK
jgi:hypothetical protein